MSSQEVILWTTRFEKTRFAEVSYSFIRRAGQGETTLARSELLTNVKYAL